MNKLTNISITPKSIVLFFAIFLLLYFLYLIADVLIALFLALIVTATLSPAVNWLVKYIKYQALAVLIIYILLFAVLLLVVVPLIPPLVAQTQAVIQNLPEYTAQASWLTSFSSYLSDWWVNNEYSVQSVLKNLSSSSQQIFQITGSVLSFFGALIIIIAISFYSLIAENNIKISLKKLLPKNKREKYWEIGRKIYQALGDWLRARTLIGILVGIFVGVGFKIIGLPFALFLGVLAGVLDIIPVIGPVVAAIPALIIGFAISPLMGILVFILLILIYMAEGYILIPKVLGDVLGVNPVIVLIALVLGAKLGGIIGVIIALPAAAVLVIILQELSQNYEVSGRQSPS